jgi:hypothetical protein
VVLLLEKIPMRRMSQSSFMSGYSNHTDSVW